MPSQIIYLAYSGGLDSTTMLYSFLARKGDGVDVRPVFFNYGSKHNPYELKSAIAILERVMPTYTLPVIDLANAGIFYANKSALLAKNNAEIPAASYRQDGSLAATVVPGRNLIMASILAGIAESVALEKNSIVSIALAVHAGDHVLYPDCRMGFVTNLRQTIRHSTENRVCLKTPFAKKSKAYIVKLGAQLGVPFELTRSCYQNADISCGKCGTCQERLEAFSKNDLQDPIPYVAR